MNPPLVCKLLEGRDPVSFIFVDLACGIMPGKKELPSMFIKEWMD